ncbi:MAG TPA: SDR family NAD(P)-dependent oxidoreductase [Prolixibacteraceae bacterium]|nr:SDR family NAD(P)-dependent oxidoreductase [Prolixibacteraceae bacterium]
MELGNYALITGASAGTGKQIAVECAKRGFNLYLVSLPDSGLEQLAEELQRNYPVDIKFLSIDLTQSESPKKVFDYAVKNRIAVNILVNNAGLGFDGKLEDLSLFLIDTMILLNIRASTLLTFLFLSEMKKQKTAYILNISSFGALVPLPFKSVYAATKTYLLFLTSALRRELKGTNIHLTSVHPCGITSERAIENVRKSAFFARAAALTPSEVAKISMDNLFAENPFVVPGLMPKIYYYLGSCIPHGIVIKLVERIFQKTT